MGRGVLVLEFDKKASASFEAMREEVRFTDLNDEAVGLFGTPKMAGFTESLFLSSTMLTEPGLLVSPIRKEGVTTGDREKAVLGVDGNSSRIVEEAYSER